jgi:hypothetical protein
MEEVCLVNRYLRLRAGSGVGLPGINHVQFIGIAFPAKIVGWALW